MSLDQGERLQDRVVDARGDLVPLLAANACGALGVAVDGEAPEPGPGDQEQRSRDRARGEHRLVDAAVGEDEHGSGGCERDAERRERRVGREAAAGARSA